MKLLDRSWHLQRQLEDKTSHFGKGKWGRVLKMAKKPDKDEYVKTLKITGIGLVLIGALGFLIYWLWENVPKFVKI